MASKQTVVSPSHQQGSTNGISKLPLLVELDDLRLTDEFDTPYGKETWVRNDRIHQEPSHTPVPVLPANNHIENESIVHVIRQDTSEPQEILGTCSVTTKSMSLL